MRNKEKTTTIEFEMILIFMMRRRNVYSSERPHPLRNSEFICNVYTCDASNILITWSVKNNHRNNDLKSHSILPLLTNFFFFMMIHRCHIVSKLWCHSFTFRPERRSEGGTNKRKNWNINSPSTIHFKSLFATKSKGEMFMPSLQ